MIVIIAAVAKNNTIGNNGTTPWSIPEEMALFRERTMGHAVLMGRKTYESIGKPLLGRRNIVLSRTMPERSEQNLAIYNSLTHALQEIQGEKTAFVIGGQEIYAQMMPFADELHISHLKKAHPGDTFFPSISPDTWKIAREQDYSSFTHIHYTRI